MVSANSKYLRYFKRCVTRPLCRRKLNENDVPLVDVYSVGEAGCSADDATDNLISCEELPREMKDKEVIRFDYMDVFCLLT